MNIQFEHEKEIINATLDEAGLFCDKHCVSGDILDSKALPGIDLISDTCHFWGIELTEHNEKLQAHPACQVEAQRRLRNATKNNR